MGTEVDRVSLTQPPEVSTGQSQEGLGKFPLKVPKVQMAPRRKLPREVYEAGLGLSSDLQPRPRDSVLVSQLLGYD